MWREPHDVIADLESDDAGRLSTALAYLRESMDGGYEFPVPSLSLSRILRLVGSKLTKDLVDDIALLTSSYQGFEPRPTDMERAQDLIDLAVNTGENGAALEANLFVKARPDLLPMVMRAVQVAASGGAPVEAVGRLVSYLLNAKSDFRSHVVSSLSGPGCSGVREWLEPEFTPGEWAELTRCST